jgi:hypothetical protein
MLRPQLPNLDRATTNTKGRSDRTSLDPVGRGVPKTSPNFVVGATAILRLAPLLGDVIS